MVMIGNPTHGTLGSRGGRENLNTNPTLSTEFANQHGKRKPSAISNTMGIPEGWTGSLEGFWNAIVPFKSPPNITND